MSRWLTPRSRVGRLVIQVVVLAVAAGAAYFLVTALGSDLRMSTLRVSDVLS